MHSSSNYMPILLHFITSIIPISWKRCVNYVYVLCTRSLKFQTRRFIQLVIFMSTFYECYSAREPHSTTSGPLTFTDTQILFCLLWIELALQKDQCVRVSKSRLVARCDFWQGYKKRIYSIYYIWHFSSILAINCSSLFGKILAVWLRKIPFY